MTLTDGLIVFIAIVQTLHLGWLIAYWRGR